MGRAVHFDVSVKDIDRAKKFYQNVFGWEITKWESPEANMDYWMVMTGKPTMPVPEDRNYYGIDGGMSVPPAGMSTTGSFVVTMDVEDADGTAKDIEDNGGKLVSERMTIPGVGYMYMAEDTEGNQFGIMESDENAKA
jgi:predicted enzyme related to lactoylglutathione lyase